MIGELSFNRTVEARIEKLLDGAAWVAQREDDVSVVGACVGAAMVVLLAGAAGDERVHRLNAVDLASLDQLVERR